MSSGISNTFSLASTQQSITPDEQLQQLSKMIGSKVSESVLDLFPDIAHIIGTYALPPVLTRWHTALDRLKILSEKIQIPPLPENIFQIFYETCTNFGTQKTSDGDHFLRVGDTHMLTLVLGEPQTLNLFEERVFKPHREDMQDLEKENALQFRSFDNQARLKYGDMPCEPTHWELQTKDLLPGSRGDLDDHNAVIDSLNRKSGANYEIPSLHGTIQALFFHFVATGERLYQLEKSTKRTHIQRYETQYYDIPAAVGGFWRMTCPVLVEDEHYPIRDVYTRVKETYNKIPLVVGGYEPSGLEVNLRNAIDPFGGIAGTRRLPCRAICML